MKNSKKKVFLLVGVIIFLFGVLFALNHMIPNSKNVEKILEENSYSVIYNTLGMTNRYDKDGNCIDNYGKKSTCHKEDFNVVSDDVFFIDIVNLDNLQKRFTILYNNIENNKHIAYGVTDENEFYLYVVSSDEKLIYASRTTLEDENTCYAIIKNESDIDETTFSNICDEEISSKLYSLKDEKEVLLENLGLKEQDLYEFADSFIKETIKPHLEKLKD